MTELRKKGRPRGRAGDSGDSGGIRALDRALDILDAIAAGNGLTLTEIGQRLQMAPSSAGCSMRPNTGERWSMVGMSTALRISSGMLVGPGMKIGF